MPSKAKTPKEYVDSLPEDRRKEIRKMRTLIRKHLPKSFKESIQYGMLNYDVPPKSNGKKRVTLSMASQASYMALYFSNIYEGAKGEKAFREKYMEKGHKLNMGKCCLRFKKTEDLNLEFIQKLIAGKFPTPFS